MVAKKAYKMKSLACMILLPLMAFGCVHWKLTNEKNFYVAPSYTMLQVTSDSHEWLYQMRNIDIKSLACMAMSLNTTLKIQGVPKFSKEEVKTLCNIPDFCFEKPEPELWEIPDNEAEIIASETK